VARMAQRRLDELEAKPLCQEQEPVEEHAGDLDVVVHHDDPLRVCGRRMFEQRVQVLELAAVQASRRRL
jgi:hypothetical protein